MLFNELIVARRQWSTAVAGQGRPPLLLAADRRAVRREC